MLNLFHSGRIAYKSFKGGSTLLIRQISLFLRSLFHFRRKGIRLSCRVFRHFVILHKDIDTVIGAFLLYSYKMAVDHPSVYFVHSFKMGSVLTLHELFKSLQKDISVKNHIRFHSHRWEKFVYLPRHILPGKLLASQKFSRFFASVSIALRLEELNVAGEPVYNHHVPYALKVVHIVFLTVEDYAHTAVFKVDDRLNAESQVAVGKFNSVVGYIIAERFIYRLDFFIVKHTDSEDHTARFDFSAVDIECFKVFRRHFIIVSQIIVKKNHYVTAGKLSCRMTLSLRKSHSHHFLCQGTVFAYAAVFLHINQAVVETLSSGFHHVCAELAVFRYFCHGFNPLPLSEYLF